MEYVQHHLNPALLILIVLTFTVWEKFSRHTIITVNLDILYLDINYDIINNILTLQITS